MSKTRKTKDKLLVLHDNLQKELQHLYLVKARRRLEGKIKKSKGFVPELSERKTILLSLLNLQILIDKEQRILKYGENLP